MNPTELQDCALIVKSFQKKLLSGSSEEEIIGGLLPSVGQIQVNAFSASANLTNALSPPIPKEVLALLGGGSDEGVKLELPGDLPDISSNAIATVENWREWVERCIPCSLRVKMRVDLAATISEPVIGALEDMVSASLDELNYILGLLNSGSVYEDACILLQAMNDICIPDLQRMVSVLSAMLYRISSREVQDADMMKLLIMPLFQPMFANITQLFGQYKVLVTDPLQCVVTNLDVQLEKLKTNGFLTNPNVTSLEARAHELDGVLSEAAFITGATDEPRSVIGTDNLAEFKEVLRSVQRTGTTIDDGISAVQQSAGTAAWQLRRLVMSGIAEVETLLAELENELLSFVGGSRIEQHQFMVRQYDKLLIVRMIQFVVALIKAASTGFQCELDTPDKAEDTLTRFLDEFLGPTSGVVVEIDPETNEIALKLGVEATIQDTSITLTPGSTEIDDAINDIIGQAGEPTVIRPKCLFKPQEADEQRLAEIISELDSIEV